MLHFDLVGEDAWCCLDNRMIRESVFHLSNRHTGALLFCACTDHIKRQQSFSKSYPRRNKLANQAYRLSTQAIVRVRILSTRCGTTMLLSLKARPTQQEDLIYSKLQRQERIRLQQKNYRVSVRINVCVVRIFLV